MYTRCLSKPRKIYILYFFNSRSYDSLHARYYINYIPLVFTEKNQLKEEKKRNSFFFFLLMEWHESYLRSPARYPLALSYRFLLLVTCVIVFFVRVTTRELRIAKPFSFSSSFLFKVCIPRFVFVWTGLPLCAATRMLIFLSFPV